MTVGSRRDLEETRRALARWLAARLGVAQLEVRELRLPRAGYSNETATFTAAWHDPDAGPVIRRLVLRIEPTHHQLFVQPDALFQARVMEALRRHASVPVPGVWFTESSRDVFGAPFYVMDQVPGRVPSDVPSWHRSGWTVELTAGQRARMYDNALTALVRLHRTDWQKGFGFLAPGDGTEPFAAHLRRLEQWYDWCAEDRRYDSDVIDAALDHVLTHRPAAVDERVGVVWGDARVGNMVFADDLSVAALLDWETTTLGPPEIDLAWWLMFDEYLCEAQGLSRLPGVPTAEATIARYEELSGRPVRDIRYFRILAGLTFALINSRLAHLLIAGGRTPEPVAADYVTRITRMTARWLR